MGAAKSCRSARGCGLAWRSQPVRQQIGDSSDDVPDILFVARAGVADVNGTYTRRWRSVDTVSDDRDGVPSYCNGNGILLFRKCLAGGRRYWYFSDSGGDLTKASGDYYRVQSEAALPPLKGWNLLACAKGTNPVPRITYGVSHSIGLVHATDAPRIQLVVLLVSGEELTRVAVSPEWKCVHVKRAIGQSLVNGRGVTKLIVGREVFRDAWSVADMDLADGGVIQAVIQGPDVIVRNSGTEAVNGNYIRQDGFMNGSVWFRNEAGTLLFKYVMKRGTHFWYFSKDGNLANAAGDYYWAESAEKLPPAVGWTLQGCPMGSEPFPELELLFSHD